MRSADCGMRNAECGVRSAEGGGRGAGGGIRTVAARGICPPPVPVPQWPGGVAHPANAGRDSWAGVDWTPLRCAGVGGSAAPSSPHGRTPSESPGQTQDENTFSVRFLGRAQHHTGTVDSESYGSHESYGSYESLVSLVSLISHLANRLTTQKPPLPRPLSAPPRLPPPASPAGNSRRRLCAPPPPCNRDGGVRRRCGGRCSRLRAPRACR